MSPRHPSLGIFAAYLRMPIPVSYHQGVLVLIIDKGRLYIQPSLANTAITFSLQQFHVKTVPYCNIVSQ